MSKEVQPKRLGKISGAFATALLMTACGGNPPATENPTSTPEITPNPTPSLIVTPTPEITPSPTLFVTPSPTIEVTPSPTPTETTEPPTLKGIIEELIAEANGNYSDIPAQDIEDKLKAVLEDQTVANTTLPPTTQTIKDVINNKWPELKTGSGNFDTEQTRLSAANSLLRVLFTGFGVNQNAHIYAGAESDGAIELILHFSYNHMKPTTFESLIEAVSQ